MVDALATSDARQDSALLVLAVVRNDDRDGLPDRLRGRVAENPLRTAVPAGDDAVQVLADDRIVARFDDGGEPAKSLLAVAKRRLDLLAFGDVDAGRMQVDDRARGVADRMHRKVDDALA